MKVRANLNERALVDTTTAPWVASPEPGVERILLDREGGEVARATSVVRYAAGSRFGLHVHERGEEFLVLEGDFRDAHGVYPRGTYVRNPWGTSHAPESLGGCRLFVKLRQIPEEDAARVCVPSALDACQLSSDEPERTVVVHATDAEWVALVRLRAGHDGALHAHPRGEEIFVIEGELRDEHGVYPAGTWLRQPPGSQHRPRSTLGCLFYVKRGLL
ncbi:cupin domain-containing protein [Sorangium sp. So ce726]|uniref:cupin domain-containing protein n=1 Tax=Sorangium sp. So ce726 TaxID=3133319 RepID=UPI003F5FF6C0